MLDNAGRHQPDHPSEMPVPPLRYPAFSLEFARLIHRGINAGKGNKLFVRGIVADTRSPYFQLSLDATHKRFYNHHKIVCQIKIMVSIANQMGSENMTPIVWLTGWPGIILSLGLLFVGLAKKWIHVMLAEVFMSLPFLILYLIGIPHFQYWSPIVVALNFAAGAALYKGHRGLSVLLVVPYTFIVLWLAYAVNT